MDMLHFEAAVDYRFTGPLNPIRSTSGVLASTPESMMLSGW